MQRNRTLFLGLFTPLTLVCACLALVAGLLLAWNAGTRLGRGRATLAAAAPTASLTSPAGIQTSTPGYFTPQAYGTQTRTASASPTRSLTLAPTWPLTGTPELTLSPAPITATGTAYPGPPAPGPFLTPGSETATPGPAVPVPAPTAAATETPTVTPTLTPTLTSTPPSLKLDAFCIPLNTASAQARVLRVLDGVTIEVELNGQPVQVRYIGLDLPEYDTDFSVWQRALEHNQQLVAGQRVLLVKDRSEADSEGRLLRYVLAGAHFVNMEMAADGYAIAQSLPPDIHCDQTLLEAETQAIIARRGIWAATPTPTRTFDVQSTPTASPHGLVVISKIAFRGEGWQQPEEYVEIQNVDTVGVQLQGWTLSDDQRHVFVFPNLVLPAGGYCRVSTNQSGPGHCGLSYHSFSPIWSDEGECGYLKDADGKLVNTFCYD